MNKREDCPKCEQLWPKYIDSTSQHRILKTKLQAAVAEATRHNEVIRTLSWQMDGILLRLGEDRAAIEKHEAEEHNEAAADS